MAGRGRFAQEVDIFDRTGGMGLANDRGDTQKQVMSDGEIERELFTVKDGAGADSGAGRGKGPGGSVKDAEEWGAISMKYSAAGIMVFITAVVLYGLSLRFGFYDLMQVYMFGLLASAALSIIGSGFGLSSSMHAKGNLFGRLGFFFGTITIGLALLGWGAILSPEKVEGFMSAYCISMMVTSVVVGIYFGVEELRLGKYAGEPKPAQESAIATTPAAVPANM